MHKFIARIQQPRSLIVIILVMAIAAGVGLWSKLSAPTNKPYARLGGDFSLQALQGEVSLHDFQGSAVILMFGYTSCPDICPGELATVAAAMRRLSAAEQAAIQVLFISVDPQRDSLQHLADYVRYFNPRFIGLSGNKSQIDTVVGRYGAFYRLVALPESAMGYSVDHSALLYLINKQGELTTTMPHNVEPAQLANNMRQLL